MSRITQSVRPKRPHSILIEVLESRALLSASVWDTTVTPQLTLMPTFTNTTISGYTPAQIRHAYGFDQVTFGSVAGNGAGPTIAIIDAYGDPNIASDLHTFDTTFGLPDPTFVKVNQTGGTRYPNTNAGWALETALDVEWAHAIAPAAKILLVQANSSSLGDLLTAVDWARRQSGVSTISMSWGANEFSSETFYDSYFTTPSGHAPVTFVASSGDTGAVPIWPSVSSNVLSVGGTSLYLNSNSTWQSESAWSGSGGGRSAYEGEPSWQQSIQATGRRTTPDVAYNADPNTGFPVYDTVNYSGQTGWFQVGGTSAGAPQWAGLIAIADQGRARNGLAPLGKVQADVYNVASSSFHDILSGTASSSFGSYAATTGYDLATGLGSPASGSGNLVIQQLTGATTTVTTKTSGGTTTSTKVKLLAKAGNDLSLGTTPPRSSSTSQPASDDLLDLLNGPKRHTDLV